MIDILFQERENEDAGRKYPFAGIADLVDTDGNDLPTDFIVDAVLYPESGMCRLLSVRTENGIGHVIVGCGSGELEGTFDEEDDTIELYSENIHRGTLLLGPSKIVFLDDPTPHVYANVPFCTSCQFVVGSNGVSSFVAGGVSVSGDVLISGDDNGLAKINPVVTQRDDGDFDLRFDVVPTAGISSNEKTGVRSIYVMRNPESFFNVLDRDGKPYLYLTRNGRMTPAALIGRDDVCRLSDRGVSDYAERSSSDDCGNSSNDGQSGLSERCVPQDIMGFLRTHDPMTSKTETGAWTYGYFDIPSKYKFSAGTTMTWFFVEGVMRVNMGAYNYSVRVSVTLTHTPAAGCLFFDGGGVLEKVESGVFYLKYADYRTAYSYLSNLSPGQLGYMSIDDVISLCDGCGWTIPEEDIGFPDGVDWREFTETLKSELAAFGYDKWNQIYVNRARDYFTYFNCKNWEVSSADYLGDELRYLVGWRTGSSSADDITTGGAAYVYSGGKCVPRWVLSRYVWWHKYCKNGNAVRHFIVPKERGLVLYTGDYYYGGVPDNEYSLKESSPLSWTCGIAMCLFASKYATAGGTLNPPLNFFSTIDTIRERLYTEYGEGYDPTFGDRSLENDGFDLEEMDRVAMMEDNRVVDDSMVIQPWGAPIIGNDDGPKHAYSLGPFEYRYGRLYKPGVGYPETPDDLEEEEAEQAIKEPVVFKFDVTEASSNSFNVDTTDLVADGMSYSNPIHVMVVSGTPVPAVMNVKDPTNMAEVTREMKKLTSETTSGHGIELSIPGLGV